MEGFAFPAHTLSVLPALIGQFPRRSTGGRLRAADARGKRLSALAEERAARGYSAGAVPTSAAVAAANGAGRRCGGWSRCRMEAARRKLRRRLPPAPRTPPSTNGRGEGPAQRCQAGGGEAGRPGGRRWAPLRAATGSAPAPPSALASTPSAARTARVSPARGRPRAAAPRGGRGGASCQEGDWAERLSVACLEPAGGRCQGVGLGESWVQILPAQSHHPLECI